MSAGRSFIAALVVLGARGAGATAVGPAPPDDAIDVQAWDVRRSWEGASDPLQFPVLDVVGPERCESDDGSCDSLVADPVLLVPAD